MEDTDIVDVPDLVTAVFVSGPDTDKGLETALNELSQAIKVERLTGSPEVCDVMRLIRVPALCVYNSHGEETARAYGNKHIPELVDSLTA